VTGGSGAIGAAHLSRARRRWRARGRACEPGPGRAQALADELVAMGGHAPRSLSTLADEKQVRDAVDALLAAGPCQILVNNAGVHRDGLAGRHDAPAWHEVIDTNLNGFFRVTQPLLMPMVRTRWGRIVNITSVAGQPAIGTGQLRRVEGGLQAPPSRWRWSWPGAASRSMRWRPA
jgi:3-oxoacyl-[acyl-carrier protein] reductase